jgi:predicted lactoylglutathione lyase
VDTAERVDELLARAERAGGKVLKRPNAASDHEHGYFADLDGNVWQIASHN